jgi:hypothetical protein
MSELVELPPTYEATRVALQRVATHVLARRRHALVGKLGLRAAPGGIATPAAGPDHEVLRTSGAWLVRERTGATSTTTSIDLRTATLADAAALADVDLASELSAGDGAPPVGDPDAVLDIDVAAAEALAGWFAFGWRALDAVVAAAAGSSPSVLQLWPEHFDAGCDLAVGRGADAPRANLGASSGDGFHPEPYLYVGPWGPERPGDPDYWNAPFGAVLGHAELRSAEDPSARALGFLHTGLAHLTPGPTG